MEYTKRKKGEKNMKKQTIKVPAYTSMRHSSELAQSAQRMSSRYFIDKKKQSKKYSCRKGF